MFCPLCGTPVPEGSTQCPKCGYNLASIGAPMGKAGEEPTAPSNAPDQTANASSSAAVPEQGTNPAPEQGAPATPEQAPAAPAPQEQPVSTAPTEPMVAAAPAPQEPAPVTPEQPVSTTPTEPMTTAAPAPQEQPASVAPAPTEPMPAATPVTPEQTPDVAPAASGQAGGVPPTSGAAPVSNQAVSPPPPPTPPAKEPWYGKTWVIVLFILFLWPVGLIFMWLKTCKWSKVAKIVVTAVIALLMVLDILYIANSMKPKTTTTGKTTTTATPTTSAKKSTPAATSSPTSGGYDTWAAECLDANKGITVYSLCELKGWQLETLATQNGYQLTTTSGGGQGLYRSSDGAIVTVNDTSGNLLNESTLQSLDKGANGQAVVYCLIAPYYSSLDACVKGIVKVSTADSQTFSDGSYAAVVYGPSATEYLILAANSDQGYTVVFYNKAALAAGALSYGTTIDEAWKNMTGRAVGANH